MNAVSSFRAFAKSATYRENTLRAKASWEGVFERIAYFGSPEPELRSDRTTFVPYEGWPFIWELAAYAAQLPGYTAIINSDIVVTPVLLDVVRVMEAAGVAAATSRRYDLATGILFDNDKGRDIFILRRRWWSKVAAAVPKSCRIGHNQWDSWMIGFLRYEAKTRFADFTMAKCIFHPAHEGRDMPHDAEVDINSKYKGYWNGTFDPQIKL